MAALQRSDAALIGALLLLFGANIAVPILSMVLGVLMALLFVVTYLYLKLSCCRKEGVTHTPFAPELRPPLVNVDKIEEVVTVAPDPDVEVVAEETAPVPSPQAVGDAPHGDVAKKSRPRLLYLDNVKSFLTVVVVLHHVTAAFIGTGGFSYMLGNYRHSLQVWGVGFCLLNQAYFMALFFFISGYFTPSSYDRKGAGPFLQDKIVRLGLPFIVYVIGLGPLVNFITAHVMLRHAYSYAPDPGPTWFIAWLLLFNMCYVLHMRGSDGSHNPLPLPRFGWLVMIGSIAGAVSGVMMAGTGNFAMMPITFGTLPFYVLFFYGGIVAKRNKWLEALPDAAVWDRRLALILTLFLSLGAFGFVAVLYSQGGGWKFLPTIDGEQSNATLYRNQTKCDADANVDGRSLDDKPFGLLVALILVIGLLLGVFCISISFTILDLSRRHLNFRNAFTAFAAEAAYAAYILQAFVIVVLAWGWERVMDEAWGETAQFRAKCNVSTTRLPPGLLWLGYGCTAVLSVLILWPMAALVRRVPGLDRVL